MPLSDMQSNKKSKVSACIFSNLHFQNTLPLSLPLPLPVENIVPNVLVLKPPPFPYENKLLLPTTLGGTNPLGGCKIHSNSISRSNPMFYVSIKVCICVCVYTWDRGFLVSHVSLGVWEMGWLHENHWVVGALLGGGLLEFAADGSGLLESAADGGGLLETEADVLVGCV